MFSVQCFHRIVVQLIFLHEPNLFTKCFKWCQSSDFSASHFSFCCTERVYKRSEREMERKEDQDAKIINITGGVQGLDDNLESVL